METKEVYNYEQADPIVFFLKTQNFCSHKNNVPRVAHYKIILSIVIFFPLDNCYFLFFIYFFTCFFFFSFIFISWRLITSQHFSGFCHTLTHSDFFKLFMYLFLVALSLRYWMWAFSSCGKWGPLSSCVHAS